MRGEKWRGIFAKNGQSVPSESKLTLLAVNIKKDYSQLRVENFGEWQENMA